MVLVSLDITVELEQRPDQWAAYVKEFSFFAYGHTKQETLEKVNSGLNALFESFHCDTMQLYNFLYNKIDSFVIRSENQEILYEKHLAIKYTHTINVKNNE